MSGLAVSNIPSVSTGQGTAFAPLPAQPLQTAEAAWLQMQRHFLEILHMTYILGFFRDELGSSTDLS